MRILGVDPGSQCTGYGIIESTRQRGKLVILAHGTIELVNRSQRLEQAERLLIIFQKLSSLIQTFRPTVMVVERVFFAKNPSSALKLGQVRGAALVSAAQFGLEVIEYAATEVKQAMTGSGRAEKEQVSKILQLLVGSQAFKTYDASDALALAVCHYMKWDRSGGLKNIDSRLKDCESFLK